ncbi:MAG TPA: (2Fe-2S)-binding protein [Pseudogracilibacillus sp.]|nr:(2Fe-2S)-binding protein [Pseudogracilibacillus sp.]
MTSKRIDNHPVLGKLSDKEKITFQFDGKTYEGYENDTIASALLANGIRTLRKHENTGNPRGIYCNIGHCFECRVTVDHQSNIRACLTPIQENMIVESGQVQPHPLHPDNDTEAIRTYEDFEQWEEE